MYLAELTGTIVTMKLTTQDLLKYTQFVNDIRKVKRAMWVIGEEVYENDVEHSYQLAMTAMYVIESEGLELDLLKVMAMALVHDVLEVHSGDTPVFAGKDIIDNKASLEERAIKRLREQWPDFTMMHDLIEEYEAKETAESRFVYALDKLIPMFNNYADGGRNWKRQQVTLDDVIRVKRGKIDSDPTVFAYYKHILAALHDRPELFSAK